MENIANRIELCGTLETLPEYSHTNHGRSFYRFSLTVERLSGTSDTLPVIAPEDVLLRTDLFEGTCIAVTGQIRSFNSKAPLGRRLLLLVYADEITTVEDAPRNAVQLRGSVCKPPVFRRTPLGREICDVMLAVSRLYRRTDYIPCILWGRLARIAADCPVGTGLILTGRLQSRDYVKLLPEGSETRTAYEVSVAEAELLPEGIQPEDCMQTL